MKNWTNDIKKLEKEKKKMELSFVEKRKKLLEKMIPSINTELSVICKWINNNYESIEAIPTFSGRASDKEFVHARSFYFWKIEIIKTDIGTIYFSLDLCGDKGDENNPIGNNLIIPEMLYLSSRVPSFRFNLDYCYKISPTELKSLFETHLQNQNFKKRCKSN